MLREIDSLATRLKHTQELPSLSAKAEEGAYYMARMIPEIGSKDHLVMVAIIFSTDRVTKKSLFAVSFTGKPFSSMIS